MQAQSAALDAVILHYTIYLVDYGRSSTGNGNFVRVVHLDSRLCMRRPAPICGELALGDFVAEWS